MINIEEVFEKFNIKNPYTRYIGKDIKPNVIGWNGIGPTMLNRIRIKKPTTIIEVGSFLGHSTTILGNCRKEVDSEFIIYSIDTWLGSYEHWKKEQCNMLNLFNFYENGISSLYDQFIINVICNNLNNNIIPLPCTSNVGYSLLESFNIKADLIYVDANHETEDVYNDLKKYSRLLNNDGIIFGDDYLWDSVRLGVEKYCNEFNKTLVLEDNVFWRIS